MDGGLLRGLFPDAAGGLIEERPDSGATQILVGTLGRGLARSVARFAVSPSLRPAPRDWTLGLAFAFHLRAVVGQLQSQERGLRTVYEGRIRIRECRRPHRLAAGAARSAAHGVAGRARRGSHAHGTGSFKTRLPNHSGKHTEISSRQGRVLLPCPQRQDVNQRFGTTILYMRDGNAEPLALSLPTGQNAARTFTTWIRTIHTAAIGGLPMQAAVSALGLLVVVISLTGVLIFFRKRASADTVHSTERRVSRRAP